MRVRYEGFHDASTCMHVGGWARDLEAPESSVAVDIVADGELLATVVADQYQEHLLQAGIGAGRHGFSYSLGIGLHDGRPHTIRVRVSGTDFDLPGTPRQIHCPHILSEPLSPTLKERALRSAQATRTATFERLRLEERVAPFPMRVHLVCYEELDEWILGKITRRLVAGLEALEMEISVGKEPHPDVDVNHHIIYWGYVNRKSTLETVMLTHIDDMRELEKVRHQLVDVGVEMGICMSSEAVHRLAHLGIPRRQLCFVNPAHDSVIRPRKLVVGVTSRVYEDGCKREQMLAQLAELLPKEQFAFSIMGSGWELVVQKMRRAGLEVEYIDHFDYDKYVSLVPRLDYYLYTGMDEGSMGFIDAVAAAVPTIVTTQGYHLDVPGGITHGFTTLEELADILGFLARQRQERSDSVAKWTWEEYARKHALIWNYLALRHRGEPIPDPLQSELTTLAVSSSPRTT